MCDTSLWAPCLYWNEIHIRMRFIYAWDSYTHMCNTSLWSLCYIEMKFIFVLYINLFTWLASLSLSSTRANSLVRSCSTLQHTATHCNTLQHTAAHCSTLQHTATHYNILTIPQIYTYWIYGNILQHAASMYICIASTLARAPPPPHSLSFTLAGAPAHRLYLALM